MARNFLDKLNTLVKSQINDLVSPVDENTSKARRKFLARHDVGRGLQNDVVALRKRIDEALAYEDQLQAELDRLYKEISDWDSRADAAVEAGQQNEARFALERMQQAQREVELNESALREHRYVTQELISQVNTLEAVVEQAQREDAEARQQSPQPQTQQDEEPEELMQRVTEKLDNTRRRLNELISSYTPEVYTPERRMPKASEMDIIDEVPQPTQSPRPPVDRKKVDDDLAARLARLSKPPTDESK